MRHLATERHRKFWWLPKLQFGLRNKGVSQDLVSKEVVLTHRQYTIRVCPPSYFFGYSVAGCCHALHTVPGPMNMGAWVRSVTSFAIGGRSNVHTRHNKSGTNETLSCISRLICSQHCKRPCEGFCLVYCFVHCQSNIHECA